MCSLVFIRLSQNSWIYAENKLQASNTLILYMGVLKKDLNMYI